MKIYRHNLGYYSKLLFLLLFVSLYSRKIGAQKPIWNLEDSVDGGIALQVASLKSSYQDHLEMSGKYMAAIVRYGVDEHSRLVLKRQLIFTRLRIIPNNTYGQLSQHFNGPPLPGITINGRPLQLQPTRFSIHGQLGFTATTPEGLLIKANLFPSMDKPAFIEQYRLVNQSEKPVTLNFQGIKDSVRMTDSSKGVYGSYVLRQKYFPENAFNKDNVLVITPGDAIDLALVTDGRTMQEQPYHYDGRYEWQKRARYLKEIHQNLVLQTPNDTINRMFDFAKIRASESIFDTKGGLMHGPGGGVYYAAIWANDQAEYMSPFFPFLGYEEGNASAINCYRLFARYMNPEYKPLPSSIIAEGTDVWQGAGDRGDQAMIAYGASRFALAYGEIVEAKRCWKLITWCLNFLETRKLPEGIIASNSDELEGRFPSGKANLSTNALAYGALVSAADLARALGHTDSVRIYKARAKALAFAIEQYFGRTIDHFETYRYYDGNTTLRSWICLPLVMGLMDRKEGTAAALLSKQLWSKNGILTEQGDSTYWDRGTLYTFRGLFNAGKTDLCYPYFSYYSAMRLLGSHVPYAIEAWPEGGQRQLSAESGLYLRAVTEGLFGIQPTGFNRFTLMPYMPRDWKTMTLAHIKAFNSDSNKEQDFSVRVDREGAKIKITVYNRHGVLHHGYWDEKTPYEITL
ncbi:glucosidase family protein [Arachidicoccus terrestris]|uniref:hypothetical protein n=1 Tax=Arachidicoccus terrestris TaxID=2875539 RepID=UPI001CC69C27|nr:hypothetical protein [Arachidicoccus terrestris]UAY55248.1 hypothetical protein K9M52_17840 [Arachidicoccus terrestris]